MKCQVCGSTMKPVVTDLPFKVTDITIVVLKGLPVIQCERCSEYLLEDKVMRRVDALLLRIDNAAELEVIKFAA
jgi:YgiT-type zinc finger domain-containing protein